MVSYGVESYQGDLVKVKTIWVASYECIPRAAGYNVAKLQAQYNDVLWRTISFEGRDGMSYYGHSQWQLQHLDNLDIYPNYDNADMYLEEVDIV